VMCVGERPCALLLAAVEEVEEAQLALLPQLNSVVLLALSLSPRLAPWNQGCPNASAPLVFFAMEPTTSFSYCGTYLFPYNLPSN
jgi:hypothetical protein